MESENTKIELQPKYRSDDIGLLACALAKAQGAYKELDTNQDAPGQKFANLQAILKAVREPLALNGLAFYQYIELLDEGSGAALLKTMIIHESGQYISSCARVVPGKNARQTGNIYEISKRLHALMLLGVAPSENDPIAFDDNGEELAEDNLIDTLRKPRGIKKPVVDHDDVINKLQYEELMIELDGYPEICKDIQEAYQIETLADLPREEYQKCRARILKIKRTEEEYRKRGR